MNRRLTRWLLLLPLTACLVGAPPVSATQETAQQTPRAEQVPAEPAPIQPIAGGEIPSRAAQIAVLLRRVRDAVETPAAIRTIAEALSPFTDTLQARLRQVDERLEAAPTSRALVDLTREWNRFDSRIGEWNSTIDARWRRLQALRTQLTGEIATWQATSDAARDVDADSPLRERIRNTLGDLESSRRTVDRALDELLGLLGRLAVLRDEVAAVTSRLQEQNNAARSGLLRRDSPPLWVSLLRMPEDPLIGSLGAAYRDAGQWVRDYLQASGGRMIWHLLVILLLGATFRSMRGTRDSLDPEDRPTGTQALDRPWSAAALASMSVVPWLYPQSPSSWIALMMLLAIGPLLRTAPLVLPETIQRPARWTTGLLVLYLLLTPAGDQSLLTRIFLLAFNPLAIAVFLSISASVKSPEMGRWRRYARIGMRVATVILVVSIAGAILGWVGMAWGLSDGTVRMAYISVVLATIGQMALGLVDLLPDTGLSRYVLHLQSHRSTVTSLLRRLVLFAIWLLWARSALVMYELLTPVTNGIRALLEWSVSIGTITISLGAVLGVLTILAATGLVSRYMRFLLAEELFTRRHATVGENNVVLTVVHYVVVSVGILIAGSAAGLSGTQLTVVAGALSVGIGFGLQAIVNNFVSGLILIFERPISVGDRVEVGAYSGIIERIGIRASVLRTYAGAEVVIPNADLITKEVTNWTLSDQRRRVNVPVGVAYGSDTAKVLEIMERVARQEPLIVEDPVPVVFFRGFGDSSLNFELFCWCNAADVFDAASKLSLAVNREFAAAGITIPFPQRDLHLRSVEPGLALGTPGEPKAD